MRVVVMWLNERNAHVLRVVFQLLEPGYRSELILGVYDASRVARYHRIRKWTHGRRAGAHDWPA